MSASVEFDTTVTATGNNTGIVVPDELIERLGAGRRPAVLVNVNGYEYRNTVGVMGGKHLISISAAVRKQTGLTGGDPIHVVLTVALTPRELNVPDDVAAALAAAPEAKAFFDKLSNSVQRYTSTTSTQRRRPRPGSGASTRPSPCSETASSGSSGPASRGVARLAGTRLCAVWAYATHDGHMRSDLETLRRWEDSGGTWRVVARTPDSVTIALLRCDGGEEVDRLVSREAGVLTLTTERPASED